MQNSEIDKINSPDSGGEDEAECLAVLKVLDRIGDKWTVMVLGALADGTLRFNTILRTINGISHRMLTLTLRSLERDGLVTRKIYPTIPPRVEYTLTEIGHSLIVPLLSLSDWGNEHLPQIEKARERYDKLSK
ncbi:hypothetical protein UA45_02915 [Morganella morganii]|uniref:HTH hxlR-type domain-containing protein n=1 Tax=Morganella morganii TaxID=582 RepID=A0A0D8LDR5_MORMO|nr:hypothetical protein UA45_02915 [Morganella morganii]HDF2340538.1 helix-turn-helix transcriptional regulator [Morganella morganii]